MILLDSSVWMEHLRRSLPDVVALLDDGQVLGHPIVRGELAMGKLSHRADFIHRLGKLPQATRATDAEVLTFVEMHGLYGLGIGYGDAHLLNSAVLSGARLWSRDRRLAEAARRLGLGD